jgi:hypothetical protein
MAREIVGSGQVRGSASYQRGMLILLIRLAVTEANIPSVTDHYRQRLIKGPSPDPELNQSLVVAASQYLNSAKPSLISETQAIGRRPKEQVQRPALPPERSFGVLVVIPSQGNSNQPTHPLSS